MLSEIQHLPVLWGAMIQLPRNLQSPSTTTNGNETSRENQTGEERTLTFGVGKSPMYPNRMPLPTSDLFQNTLLEDRVQNGRSDWTRSCPSCREPRTHCRGLTVGLRDCVSRSHCLITTETRIALHTCRSIVVKLDTSELHRGVMRADK
jgi:hypothetical protein